MRTLVDSLLRLYRSGKITEQQLKKMVSNKKITQEEYNYIVHDN